MTWIQILTVIAVSTIISTAISAYSIRMVTNFLVSDMAKICDILGKVISKL